MAGPRVICAVASGTRLAILGGEWGAWTTEERFKYKDIVCDARDMM